MEFLFYHSPPCVLAFHLSTVDNDYSNDRSGDDDLPLFKSVNVLSSSQAWQGTQAICTLISSIRIPRHASHAYYTLHGNVSMLNV